MNDRGAFVVPPLTRTDAAARETGDGPNHPQTRQTCRKFRDKGVDSQKKDAKLSVVPITMIKLRTIIQSAPDDLIFTLMTPRLGFKERLTTGSLSDEMTELLVKTLSHTCLSVHSTTLIEFLKDVVSSKFLNEDLLNFINKNITEKIRVEKGTLKDILTVLRKVSERFPSKSLIIMTRLAPQLQYLIKSHKDRFKHLLEEYNLLEDGIANIRKNIQSGIVVRDQEKLEEWTVETSNNFRRLSVEPTISDIQGEGDPFLRKNKIYQEYANVDDYLDVQFRLLKEDFLRPLREGLQDYLHDRDGFLNGKVKSNIKIYTDVRISVKCCSRQGLVYALRFDTKRLKDVNWTESKRLLPGSLVCLSSDQFKNILIGRIAERNVEDLYIGITQIYIEECNNDMRLLRFLHVYEMIESRTYYEPYRNVLRVLQHTDSKSVPFEKYLLNQKQKGIPPPRYLQIAPRNRYDFSSLVQAERKTRELTSGVDRKFQTRQLFVPVSQTESWPSADDLKLDESQYNALRTALTKEFVLIQGPPGTGKSFIGLKIIQMLLNNHCSNGPIMVVCYTNHALDQFLEAIIALYSNDSKAGRFVRVGSRTSSENPKLKACLLENLRKEERTGYGLYLNQERKRVYRTQEKILKFMAYIQLLEYEIIHFKLLEGFMDCAPFKNTLAYLAWLSGEYNDPTMNHEEFSDHFSWIHTMWDWEDDDDSYDEEFSEDEEEYKCHKKVQEEQQYDDFYYSIRDHTVFVQGKRDSNPWNGFLRQAKVLLRELREHKEFTAHVQTVPEIDIWKLNLEERWMLYKYWTSCFADETRKKLARLINRLQIQQGLIDEIYDEKDCRILNKAQVIALTTSGAAKISGLLKRIKPKIVIVEEAAEVLESHIVACLTESCEHLILIGDHQQLRPKPADYVLCKHYHLDVSLFEKVFLNQIHCVQLTTQHRMRPEIARLLVPHIYKSLLNHESVERYENVAGVFGNMFFVTHSEQESAEDDDKSHSNKHEALFLTAFCQYLLNVGYETSQITILATYVGQSNLLQKLMPNKEIRITQVDNYQGEENDIILLSLVRSNRKNSIGFLAIQNRVCVALSRARKGLYIIGNGELLSSVSPLWRDILQSLKQENRYVNRLPLGCRLHPDQAYFVANAKDFRVVPTSGCSHPCGYRLPCGHACDRNCHELDLKHVKFKCKRPCQRTPIGCYNGHPCKQFCHEDCYKCLESVEKTLKRCLHKAVMPCSSNEADFSCREPCEKKCPDGHPCQKLCSKSCACEEPVTITLVSCGHRATVPCREKNKPTYKCQEVCINQCQNGHPCQNKCSEPCGLCTVLVQKSMPKCHHKAFVRCHLFEVGLSIDKCQRKCERVCPLGHSCEKLCYQSCGDCSVAVIATFQSCPHEIVVPCHLKKTGVKCTSTCERLCPEGHKCGKRCGEECGPCKVLIEKLSMKCTHKKLIPCCESPDTVPCAQPCEMGLSCGHMCRKQCGDSQCTQICLELVEVKLACGHFAKLKCFETQLSRTPECLEKVEVRGETCEYGHTKLIKCGTTLEAEHKCDVPVTLACSTNLPHHGITVPCHTRFQPELTSGCDQICNVQLECGHLCLGTCHQCIQDGTHKECTELCGKSLPFCLHKCEAKCGVTCPPCKVRVDRPCSHGSFQRLCSSSYEQCSRPCTWKCKHGGCKYTCSKPCDRQPCNEPCDRLLKCRHQCIGLCGEPCPVKCLVCNIAEVRVTSQESGDSSSILPRPMDFRFVMLMPCEHIIEVNFMDDWFRFYSKYPPYRVDRNLCISCPICGQEVGTCPRYNRVLKAIRLHLSSVQSRIGESEIMRNRIERAAESWLRSNSIRTDCITQSEGLRLRLGGIFILHEIGELLRMTSSECRQTFNAKLRDIGMNLVHDWAHDGWILIIDLMRLYLSYMAVQMSRIERFMTGPKLRIIDRCKEILRMWSTLELGEPKYDELWKIIEKLNRFLSKDLEPCDRKDHIEDYLLHLNQCLDEEVIADLTSNWFCCTQGHVFSTNKRLDNERIDENCLRCHPTIQNLIELAGQRHSASKFEIDQTSRGQSSTTVTERKEVSST